MDITCAVLQGSVLWLVLFNFPINSLADRTESTHINCERLLALWRAGAEYRMILINCRNGLKSI